MHVLGEIKPKLSIKNNKIPKLQLILVLQMAISATYASSVQIKIKYLEDQKSKRMKKLIENR